MKKASNKCFSFKLFIQGLKNTRVAGIGLSAVFITLNLLATLIHVALEDGEKVLGRILITGNNILPLSFLIIPVAMLITNSAFSFLNKRKSCDFYHALPQKRICVFLSFLASCLTWIAFMATTSVVISTLICFFSQNHTIFFSHALLVLCGVILAGFFASAVALVCKMLSGNNVAFWFYTISLYISPKIISYIFINFISSINFSYIKPTYLISSLNPYTPFIFFDTDSSKMLNLGGTLNAVLLASEAILEIVLLFALSAFLYCRRKSECAEKSIVSKKWHAFFRTLILLPVLFFVFQDFSFESTQFIIIALAPLAHFLLEMIISKSAKNAAISLPWFLVPVVIAASLVGIAYGTEAVYIASAPKAENVSSVMISRDEYLAIREAEFLADQYEDYRDYDFYNNLAFRQDTYFIIPTKDSNAINSTINSLDNKVSFETETETETEQCYETAVATFTLKNGKEVKRIVHLSKEDFFNVMAGVSQEEKFKTHFSLPEFDELTYTYCALPDSGRTEGLTQEIYTQFLEEYNALSLQKQLEVEFHRGDYDALMYIKSEKLFSMLCLNEESFPKTCSLLEDFILN